MDREDEHFTGGTDDGSETELVQPAEDESKEAQTNAEDGSALAATFAEPVYQFDSPWVNIGSSSREFESCSRPRTFLKGCKWSPDGSCLLTCADDNILRLYDLPTDLYQPQFRERAAPAPSAGHGEMNPSLRIREGELVYDYCWHPQMSSWSPDTCL